MLVSASIRSQKCSFCSLVINNCSYGCSAPKSNDSHDLFLLATTIRGGLPATTRPRILLAVPGSHANTKPIATATSSINSLQSRCWPVQAAFDNCVQRRPYVPPSAHSPRWASPSNGKLQSLIYDWNTLILATPLFLLRAPLYQRDDCLDLPVRAIMASKRGGPSSLPQTKRVLRSAGDQPNTDEPLT
eukprot:IDg21225t1